MVIDFQINSVHVHLTSFFWNLSFRQYSLLSKFLDTILLLVEVLKDLYLDLSLMIAWMLCYFCIFYFRNLASEALPAGSTWLLFCLGHL